MDYTIILKSGLQIPIESKDRTRSIIGLWNWSVEQKSEKVLSFQEGAVLASEIAVILDHRNHSDNGNIGRYNEIEIEEKFEEEEF